MPRPRLAALAAAITLTLGHACAQADDQLQAKVDQIIRPLMQEQGISGMAVAIYARDHAHYFSYGVASKADNVPVSRDTLFEIGSLSKTMVALALATLVTSGKLSWEDRVRRWLGDRFALGREEYVSCRADLPMISAHHIFMN